jgi:hypothetical protein
MGRGAVVKKVSRKSGTVFTHFASALGNDLERSGRSLIQTLPWPLPGGTDKNYEKSQS